MWPRVRLRLASLDDVPVLREVIEASVRGLQAQDYTPAQIEAALKSVYGVDTQLIADGTYFVAEAAQPDAGAESVVVGCGGWSKRKTLFGGDQWANRQDSLLDPERDAAKIRAFFVHPAWVRRGIGGMILGACERAAKSAGFKRLEMGATLSGVAFYKAKGYAAVEDVEVPLGDGQSLPIVRMAKPNLGPSILQNFDYQRLPFSLRRLGWRTARWAETMSQPGCASIRTRIMRCAKALRFSASGSGFHTSVTSDTSAVTNFTSRMWGASSRGSAEAK